MIRSALGSTADSQSERLNRNDRRPSLARKNSSPNLKQSATESELRCSAKALQETGFSGWMTTGGDPPPEDVILSHLIEITTCLDAKTGRVSVV